MMLPLVGRLLLATAPLVTIDLPDVRISQPHWLTGEPQSNARLCEGSVKDDFRMLLPAGLLRIDVDGVAQLVPFPSLEPPVWFEALPAEDPLLAALELQASQGYLVARHRGGLTLYRRDQQDAWNAAWSGEWTWPDEDLWPDRFRGLGSGLASTYLSSRAVWRVDPASNPPLEAVYEAPPRLELATQHDLFSSDRRFAGGIETVATLQLFELDGAPAWVTRETRENNGSRSVALKRIGSEEPPARLTVPSGHSLLLPRPDPGSAVLVTIARPTGAAAALPGVHRELRIAPPDQPEHYRSWTFADPLAHRRVVSFGFIDDDDTLDLIVQELEVAGPDPRESLARLTTESSIGVRIMIFAGGDGSFSATPDWVRRVEIELFDPPVFQCERLRALLQGNLIALAPVLSDYADLLVHETPGTLRLYRGGPDGFAREPALETPIAEDARVRFLPRRAGGAWPALEETTASGIATRLLMIRSDGS